MKPQDRARQLRPYIEEAAASLPDEDALEAVELFPVWQPYTLYERGIRLSYNSTLYRVEQTHTSQAIYPPGPGTEALYSEVEQPGQGDTPDNPIPYNNNMELHNGKYYSQYDVVYRCIRDTGVPVYNDLKDLVGLYVEVYEP